MNNSFTRNLLISTFLWILFLVLTNNWMDKLLLLAIFLAIPLVLFLVPIHKRDGSESRYHTFLLDYHPYIAVTAGLALVFPSGWLSGALSIPWTLYLIGVAGFGLRRIIERGWYILEENAIDIGFLYAILGGICFSIYCFDSSSSVDQTDTILLTALHFHFTAIFAPIFMGFVGRTLTIDQKNIPLYRLTTIGIMVSPLLIAIGVATTTIITVIATILFAICLCIYSYFVLIHISKKIMRIWIRICLQLSAVVVVLTIFSSVIANLGTWLNSSEAIIFHETVNAIGYVLLGLLGWVYLQPKENLVLYALPRLPIEGDKKIGKNFFEEKGMVWQNQHYAGLVDNLEKFSRNDFFPTDIHPKIRSFFENTILYDLSAQFTWHKGFNWLAKIYKPYGIKMEQFNTSINPTEVIMLTGKLIAVRGDENTTRKNLRAWIKSNKSSNKAISVAVYAEHQTEHETFMQITFPIPNNNITEILRLEHGADQSLQLTSLPRGGHQGDEGIYLMQKKFNLRLPFNKHFFIWVDEYGRLQATERIWAFGFKMLTIEYEISGKAR